jgi:LuxR family quorum sensing-dependent transcriptional regulator
MINLDGSLTTVLAMGRDIDAADPYLRASAHMLSMYYASIARRLRRRAGSNQTPIHLTGRQLECLKWVRDGKSSTDIGEILGLSSRTVDEYLAHACTRLGVKSRFQAVTEAYLHGLLEL